MSTNHNRIKVADLETNEPDKVLKTNEYGELEFSKINLDNDSFFESGSGTNSIVLKNKNNNHVTGIGAVVLGSSCEAGIYAHAEGQNTRASGSNAHSEGKNTVASGAWSHAQGNNTTASSFGSHAQGVSSISSGYASHAQGEETLASGNHSFAGGYGSTAAGSFSIATGFNTQANGESSLAHGKNSIANGVNSVVFGNASISDADNVVVLGRDIVGSQADTTYVNKLNIKYLNTGSTMIGIGLDSNGDVIGNPPQNLQSVLDTGSGATTNNELTIWSPRFRFSSSQRKGAIFTDGQGMNILGQEGGLYLEGNAGGLHLGNTTIIDFNAPTEFLSETRLKSTTRVKNGNFLIFEGSENHGFINKSQNNGASLQINCEDGILANDKYIATAVNGVTADRSGMIVTMAINNTTTPLSLSDLNSTYPNVLPAYRVQCFGIENGAIIYEKSNISSNGIPQWFKYSATRVL